MTKAKLPRAEQLRRHREIFLLAREHGVTLIEAEKIIARQEWEAAQKRLDATKRCGRALPPAPNNSRTIADQALRPIPDNAPWMMRD